jgi:hypothetical protein
VSLRTSSPRAPILRQLGDRPELATDTPT